MSKVDPYASGEPVVWIVCGSRRARERLIGKNANRQCYHANFSDKPIAGRGIYPIPAAEAERALKIKGCRKLADRRVSDLSPCWSM